MTSEPGCVPRSIRHATNLLSIGDDRSLRTGVDDIRPPGLCLHAGIRAVDAAISTNKGLVLKALDLSVPMGSYAGETLVSTEVHYPG